jgi:hypothetical protein
MDNVQKMRNSKVILLYHFRFIRPSVKTIRIITIIEISAK